MVLPLITFKTPLRKTEAFWIEFGLLGHVVLNLALQTMAGISSNFFDVSFYAFTNNYSNFTLLFKPLLFSEYVASTIKLNLNDKNQT
jgi:hypothetical protein